MAIRTVPPIEQMTPKMIGGMRKTFACGTSLSTILQILKKEGADEGSLKFQGVTGYSEDIIVIYARPETENERKARYRSICDSVEYTRNAVAAHNNRVKENFTEE